MYIFGHCASCSLSLFLSLFFFFLHQCTKSERKGPIESIIGKRAVVATNRSQTTTSRWHIMCVQGHADKGLIHTPRQKDLHRTIHEPRAALLSVVRTRAMEPINRSILNEYTKHSINENRLITGNAKNTDWISIKFLRPHYAIILYPIPLSISKIQNESCHAELFERKFYKRAKKKYNDPRIIIKIAPTFAHPFNHELKINLRPQFHSRNWSHPRERT